MNQLRVEAVTLRPVVLNQNNILKLIYNNNNVLHNKTSRLTKPSELILKFQNGFTSKEEQDLHHKNKADINKHEGPSPSRYLINSQKHHTGNPHHYHQRHKAPVTEEPSTPAPGKFRYFRWLVYMVMNNNL